jgi:hypothetical protein
MPVYQNSEHLYENMKLLFGQIQALGPQEMQSVTKANLVIRFRLASPAAEVVINGRRSPLQVTYGPTQLRPDLDVDLSADAFHQILLATLPLRKALASGKMKVRGPVHKTIALEDILHHGQAIYPQLVREQGLDRAASG